MPARGPRVVALVLLAACVISFSLGTARHAWVNDDAFITFRYARHCASGAGFVWNVDEPTRVEGSSSLAWTGLNALAIRAGLGPLVFSHRLGWLAGALVLAIVAFGAHRVLGVHLGWAWVASAFLALQRQWITWSISGMETSAAACVALAATLMLLHEARGGKRRGYASGALFFVGTLFRPEIPLLHAAAAAGIAAGSQHGRPWRTLFQSVAVHALGGMALTLWRWTYFGQPLPNTFYAKSGSPQLGLGVDYLVQFVLQNHVWLWLLPVCAAVPLAWRHARAPFVGLVVQVFAWCAWIVVLGGGRWEFRFFVPILPTCALLIALSCTLLARHGLAGLRRRAATTVAVVLAAAILGSQGLVLRTPLRAFNDVLSKEQLLELVDYMTLEASLLARYLGPDERVGTGWAGAFPFYTRIWHYDPWGLNEPTIARRPRDDAAVVFHQRHANWSDLVENRVQFVDVFNHFLFPRPFDPARARNVTPWTQPGIPIYSVRLPEGHYWLFSSTWKREELDGWLTGRGLEILSVAVLPAGWPELGQ